jgi:hypothetical protein
MLTVLYLYHTCSQYCTIHALSTVPYMLTVLYHTCSQYCTIHAHSTVPYMLTVALSFTTNQCRVLSCLLYAVLNRIHDTSWKGKLMGYFEFAWTDRGKQQKSLPGYLIFYSRKELDIARTEVQKATARLDTESRLSQETAVGHLSLLSLHLLHYRFPLRNAIQEQQRESVRQNSSARHTRRLSELDLRHISLSLPHSEICSNEVTVGRWWRSELHRYRINDGIRNFIISDTVNKVHTCYPLFFHIVAATTEAFAIQRVERSVSCWWGFLSCVIRHYVTAVYTWLSSSG